MFRAVYDVAFVFYAPIQDQTYTLSDFVVKSDVLTLGECLSTSPPRRAALVATLAIAVSTALPLAVQAQETPIKFQLDWRFEGPAALFLVPAAKGYFKQEKLNVTVDAGNGSGGTVTRTPAERRNVS